MTREDAKKLLPIIQAWADGKTIQLKDVDLDWKDITKCNVYFVKHPSEYRIKAETNQNIGLSKTAMNAGMRCQTINRLDG